MRDPSPYAGKTVRLRDNAYELGGLDITVADWYENTGTGLHWFEQIDKDPRAGGYAVRRGLAQLPDDDEVLFGRVDGMGQLVHASEIQGAASGPVKADRRPQMVTAGEVGEPCIACATPLRAGDMVYVLPLGPGDDPKARTKARTGMPFEAKTIELHWACATGDESYAPPGG